MSARYSRDGSQIALGFENGSVLVTDAELGGEREVLGAGEYPVNRVAFSPDGTRVAAASGDGTRPPSTGQPASTLGTADENAALAASTSTPAAASPSPTRTVR